MITGLHAMFYPAEQASREISFYCDDIEATVAELKKRGVEFTSEIGDREWGLVATFRMPGDVEVDLFQPKYVKS